MEIIPAIDIIEGKCVRLSKGDYQTRKVYSDNPLQVARQFEDIGIKRLHLVDLDGAKSNHIVNLDILSSIASKTSLTIDFGGGIKSDRDIRLAFDAGADLVTGGSIAVRDKDLFSGWLNRYGTERIILGADVRNEMVAVSGWLETSGINVIDLIDTYVRQGITYVICTDIEKDGILAGPSIDLYRRILDRFNTIRLIASGGVSSLDDIRKLEELGVWGTITGKALYEGRIKLHELKTLLT